MAFESVAVPHEKFTSGKSVIGDSVSSDYYNVARGTNTLVLENLPVGGAGLLLDNLMQRKDDKGIWRAQPVRSFFVNETGNIQFSKLRDSEYSVVFNSLSHVMYNRFNLKIGDERNIIRISPETVPSYAVITSINAGLESYNYVSDVIPRLTTLSGNSTYLYMSGCADTTSLLGDLAVNDVTRFLDDSKVKFSDIAAIDTDNDIITIDDAITDFDNGTVVDFLSGSGIGGSPYVTFSWRRDFSNQLPQYWTVFYKWSGVEWQHVTHVTGRNISATVNELSFATEYDFRIRGVGAGYQNGRWSNTVTITTPSQEGSTAVTDSTPPTGMYIVTATGG